MSGWYLVKRILEWYLPFHFVSEVVPESVDLFVNKPRGLSMRGEVEEPDSILSTLQSPRTGKLEPQLLPVSVLDSGNDSDDVPGLRDPGVMPSPGCGNGGFGEIWGWISWLTY